MDDGKTEFQHFADLIGEAGALNLCEQYGGVTLYIRKDHVLPNDLAKHWTDFFGEEALEILSKNFGGKRIYIPCSPPGSIEKRNNVIVERLRSGESVADIARFFQLTQRSVHTIYGRYENLGE
jgi:DNA-binding NarL/FixJ family response regulator